MRHVCDQVCFQTFTLHLIIHGFLHTITDFVDFFCQFQIFSRHVLGIDTVIQITCCQLLNTVLDGFFSTGALQHFQIYKNIKQYHQKEEEKCHSARIMKTECTDDPHKNRLHAKQYYIGDQKLSVCFLCTIRILNGFSGCIHSSFYCMRNTCKDTSAKFTLFDSSAVTLQIPGKQCGCQDSANGTSYHNIFRYLRQHAVIITTVTADTSKSGSI